MQFACFEANFSASPRVLAALLLLFGSIRCAHGVRLKN